MLTWNVEMFHPIIPKQKSFRFWETQLLHIITLYYIWVIIKVVLLVELNVSIVQYKSVRKGLSKLTPIYAKNTHNHISFDKGLMKLRTPGLCFFGLYTIMLIPKDINGLENSITRSRSELIVRAEMAMSASYKNPRSSIMSDDDDHDAFTSLHYITCPAITIFSACLKHYV